MLKIKKNLHATIEGKILKGLPQCTSRQSACHYGGQMAQAKAPSPTCSPAIHAMRLPLALCATMARPSQPLPPKSVHRLVSFSFQYPVEIPGVTMTNLLRTAVNSIRAARGEQPMSASEFLKLICEKQKLVELKTELTGRSVNVGFFRAAKRSATKYSKWQYLSPSSLFSTKPTRPRH